MKLSEDTNLKIKKIIPHSIANILSQTVTHSLAYNISSEGCTIRPLTKPVGEESYLLIALLLAYPSFMSNTKYCLKDSCL